MSSETTTTPWSYDELQLMGAELGDTVDFINADGDTKTGVIILLNKMTVYVLTIQHEVVKFSRTTLISLDNEWELIGLAEKQIRVSAEIWKQAKNNINKNLAQKGE